MRDKYSRQALAWHARHTFGAEPESCGICRDEIEEPERRQGIEVQLEPAPWDWSPYPHGAIASNHPALITCAL